MKAALLLALEQANPEDWKLRCDWLQSHASCAENLVELAQVAEKVLQTVFSHPLTERIVQVLKELDHDGKSK